MHFVWQFIVAKIIAENMIPTPADQWRQKLCSENTPTPKYPQGIRWNQVQK